jgi:hypothetical protein
MRSQTTRSAGLSDANATIDFLFSVQEEKIANPIAKSKILFIFKWFCFGKSSEIVVSC